MKKNITTIGSIVSLLFGLIFSLIGIVNIFWGNDSIFGGLLLFLSFLYYPPVQRLIQKKTGFSIPGLAKIAIGLLILWASLGVGELFQKIDLMLKSSGS